MTEGRYIVTKTNREGSKIKVGDNVRIGANCVVFEDIPDNATVVLTKPRVIIKPPDYTYFVSREDERNHKEDPR